MPRPTISISPTPVYAGTSVTIQAGANQRLVVDMDPGGRTTVVTDASGSATFTPSNAGALYVSDPTGQWAPASEVVLP